MKELIDKGKIGKFEYIYATGPGWARCGVN
jgi:predicted dehydrogenase